MKPVRKNITSYAAIITLSIAVLILCSWIFSGAPSVKFNTALCLALSSLALFFLNCRELARIQKIIAYGCSVFVLIMALLTLAEYIFTFDAGIDELFWKGANSGGTPASGRMSVATAILFLLLATVHLLLRLRRFHLLIQIILITGFILLALVFLVNISLANRASISVFRASTLHTSFAFLLLYIGSFFSYPLSYLRFSFEKRMIANFSFAILLLILVFFSFRKTDKNFVSTNRLVNHTNEVLLKAAQAGTDAAKMQSSIRGYLLTGNENFIPAFDTAASAAIRQVGQLKTLTKDNAEQQARIDSLQQLVNFYIQSRKGFINIHGRPALDEATIKAAMQEGKDITERISLLITAVQQKENALLAKRKAANEKSISNSSRAVTLFQVVIALLLILAFVIVYNNIRKRRKAEDELWQLNRELESRVAEKTREALTQEKQYHFLIENMQEGIQILDFNWRYLYVNKAFMRQRIRPDEELVGHVLTEKYPGIEKTELFQSFRYCMQERRPARIQHANGKGIYELSIEPVPEGLFVLSMDVTERVKAEATLRESEERRRLIMNAALDAIVCMDTKGAVTFWNPQAEKIFGWKENEIIGRLLADYIVPEAYREGHTRGLEQYLRTGRSKMLNVVTEVNAVNRQGKEFPIELAIIPIRQDNGEFFCAFIRDISERKQYVEQLKHSEAQLVKAQKIAKLASWQWHKAKGLVDPAPNMLGLLQWPKDRELTTDDFVNLIHPEDRNLFKRELQVALENGTHLNSEFRVGAEENQIKFLHINSEIYYDETGQPQGFAGTIQDVTELKRSEAMLKQLNQNLEKRAVELKASNAELERFAFVASHDLQEPLRMISSFLSLLEQEASEQLDDAAKEYIHYAVDGADRLKKLIDALLEYSRLSVNKENLTQVDCNRLVGNVQDLLKLKIRESHATLDIKTLPVVTGLESQLQQLFQNLIGNALKYHNHSAPRVEIGCTEEPGMWTFYVKDNGIGIDPKYFDKIFIIFQRLHDKTKYPGTGIGLAICKKIVERHGGRIWVTSEAGQGSTFYFTIPKQEAGI